MATKPSVIFSDAITSRCEHDVTKYTSWIKRCGQNYETSWDIVSLLNNSCEINTFEDPVSQLTKIEEHFFQSHVITPLKDLPKSVNPDELLEITKQVGLKCPECGQKNVKYNMVQSRSADEGMTAQCECRECKNRFDIKM
jgi:DNA-directed RNA polymerase subunit M/transcription elongation factor TFIIS